MNIDTRIKKYLNIVLIIIMVVIIGYLFINYIVKWTFPFIIAWLIAFIIQPIPRAIHKKTGWNMKFLTFMTVLLFFIIISFLVFFLLNRIVYELNVIAKSGILDLDAINIAADNIIHRLEEQLKYIPFSVEHNLIGQVSERANVIIDESLKSFGIYLAEKVPLFITQTIKLFPVVLISGLITVISTFYISLDYNKINCFIMQQVPEKGRSILIDIKNKFLSAIYKYIRAYAIIISITFCELVVGFLIISVDYAFTLAALISVIDILPVLGSGMVFVPWGIIVIISGDYFLGFALLVLYAVIEIIRQIIEPRIVGKSIGLYPVVMLITVYAGFRIFGVTGMFLFPILILLLKNLNDEGKIKLWRNISTDNKEKPSINKKKRSDNKKLNIKY